MERRGARRVRTGDSRDGDDRRGALELSRFCLDTSAYTWLKRGEQEVVALVDSARWIGMPAIVLGELELGFRRGSQRQRNEHELVDFLGHPSVEELSVDHDVARLYAEIVDALREKGTPIPANDVWIAATAARAGATVVSYDAHFSAVERIGTILLEPESLRPRQAR